ncbi:uncharacterized protein K452DRAFT_44850 [Aplosporella prunicola CBS 121167]|uniref:Uncharacterized protein n=1 Tax=Aplosporella prunicola CBS 121167 TaxID=1176127 RepID=A0A6A6BDR8_9PEZI|nr:uncharacterized protein K452DRAFT_44850 [Aplosporella prunicola CBS 121167]KAF2141067.1 hypothetical protein K452DRAFT_44850 [Aplosporella prunicola CBS 121167]
MRSPSATHTSCLPRYYLSRAHAGGLGCELGRVDGWLASSQARERRHERQTDSAAPRPRLHVLLHCTVARAPPPHLPSPRPLTYSGLQLGLAGQGRAVQLAHEPAAIPRARLRACMAVRLGSSGSKVQGQGRDRTRERVVWRGPRFGAQSVVLGGWMMARTIARRCYDCAGGSHACPSSSSPAYHHHQTSGRRPACAEITAALSEMSCFTSSASAAGLIACLLN